MATRTIRVILICVAACALLSVLFASSFMNAEEPAEIDMSAVITGLSANASFQYSFISADRLKQGTIVGRCPIPSEVREMWSLGTDNLLVVSAKESPGESRYAKRYEETISIFDPAGNLLAQKPIGDYRVKDVYQSRDGSLVNIYTENDHNVLNIVTDLNGSSFLQIGYRSVLMPSWSGDYFINMSGRGTSNTSTLVIDAGGQEKRIPAVLLLNKDESAREAGPACGLLEESKRVLGVFPNGELLLSECDSAGLDCALMLYNADEGRMIWTKGVPPLTSLEAVCTNAAHSRTYLLMNPAANERGVQSFVISKENGEVISEVHGSGVWSSIGSNDSHFYSIFSEEPPPEQRPKYRFILKHTPKFTIESYGVLSEYHSLHSMRLCGDYLYGSFENCPIDGRTIPRATAIFRMGNLPSQSGRRSPSIRRIVPTILEGAWHIRNITAGEVELIGQFELSWVG